MFDGFHLSFIVAEKQAHGERWRELDESTQQQHVHLHHTHEHSSSMRAYTSILTS